MDIEKYSVANLRMNNMNKWTIYKKRLYNYETEYNYIKDDLSKLQNMKDCHTNIIRFFCVFC